MLWHIAAMVSDVDSENHATRMQHNLYRIAAMLSEEDWELHNGDTTHFQTHRHIAV
jgi:hypothetical protein